MADKTIKLEIGDSLKSIISYIVGTIAIEGEYKADCIKALNIDFTRIIEKDKHQQQETMIGVFCGGCKRPIGEYVETVSGQAICPVCMRGIEK